MKLRNTSMQSGFTIVELMIATMVFTVVLMVIVLGVTAFSNDYYKGVTSSATQSAARNILNNVAQAIQFSATDPTVSASTNPTGYLCAGNQQFVFSQGNELPIPVSGYAMSQLSGDTCSTHGPTGTELLQPHMRLTQFAVHASGNLWTITVNVAYGDNDLLCAPTSQPSSCDQSAATLSDANLIAPDVTCKTGAGTRFCATAQLTTTVARRL